MMPERSCVGCKRKDDWGCDAKEYTDTVSGKQVWYKPAKQAQKVDEQELWHCPRQHMNENPLWWNEVLLLYGMFKRGFLPDQGAVVDQSNRALSIFGILDEVNAEIDKAQMEREAKKRNGGGRAPPKKGRG